MSNFKLKHQRNSGLLNNHKIHMSELQQPKIRVPRPVFEPKLIEFDRNRERNRIKYENQERRRLEDEARQRMIDQVKLISQMERERPRRVIPTPDVDPALQMMKNNSATPYKLPHQSKAALHSNHHDFDPKNREIYESMPQHVKDSLHSQANKYGKSFWSDQHQVNVDPEDGVLSNRPRDGQGNYFKFETENKPIEERVNEAYSKIRDQYLSMAGKKKHPMLPAKDEDQMFQEFLGEYHSSKYDPETGEVKILKNVDDEDGFISEEELAKVPSYLRNPFAN